MTTPSIRELIEDAKSDPSLLSSIDVDRLLDSLENTKNSFLEGNTLKTVAQAIFDSLSDLPISREIRNAHCQKLLGYRLVDEIYTLHKGKHVRWIRIDAPEKIMVGGIVVDIRFVDDGINVLCRLHSARFTQYRFDQCITFQKLTDDEQLILMLYGE